MIQGNNGLVMPVMQLTGITKHFGGLAANEHVDFTLFPGEIHALVGENGAGKSTLMNIVYGILRPDSGEIRIRDERVEFGSPADAIERGIGMVHQHFMLVPSFSIAENITLGAEPRKARLFDRASARAASLVPMEKLGLNAKPETIVGTLNVASQQKVEIAKILYRGASIIILDEPTAVLTPQETDELFDLLTNLAQDGASIVFISHKLREVFAIADRITVLRAGTSVLSSATHETSVDDVVAAMTGRSDVNLGRVERAATTGTIALQMHDVRTERPEHDSAVNGVSLTVRGGEIIGIAGVEGNGQSSLAEVLIGTAASTAGTVSIGGRDLTNSSVTQRRDAGLGFVPEDRQLEGLPINGTIIEALIPGHVRPTRGFRSLGMAVTRALLTWSQDVLTKFAIKAPSPSTYLRHLSGGNQQKVVLARELEAQPSVLVLSQPTRGVDLGAIDFIYSQIKSATEAGCAVLLISADLDEILRLSDRILVMYEGQMVLDESIETATRERLGLYMTGSHMRTASP